MSPCPITIGMKYVYKKNDFKVMRTRNGAGLGLVTKRVFKRGDKQIKKEESTFLTLTQSGR